MGDHIINPDLSDDGQFASAQFLITEQLATNGSFDPQSGCKCVPQQMSAFRP